MLIYNDEKIAYPHLISLQSENEIFEGNFVNLLDALPNLQLLHLNARNIPYKTENLERILTMPKLKDVTLKFQLPIPNETAENANADKIENDSSILKDLCKKLLKFEFKFIADTNENALKLKKELTKELSSFGLIEKSSFSAVRTVTIKNR
jgi:hypothetical protein